MGRYGYDISPSAADLREAKPIPLISVAGPHRRIQSVDIKYLQKGIFWKHFNRCIMTVTLPVLQVACDAWFNSSQLM